MLVGIAVACKKNRSREVVGLVVVFEMIAEFHYGGIGFVGLVTPHMIRLIVGANHRRTLPACLYGGAIFLLLADLISRTILAPAVLPVGVVTSIIGAAAFLVIFLRTKRRERA